MWGSTDVAARAGVTGQPARASRLRVPSWRDPRLLVGLALVLAAVAAGAWVVALADATTPVYTAERTLTPGAALTTDAVSVTRVRVPGVGGTYLTADRPLDDVVAIRTLTAGELVPLSAVGSAGDLSVRPVVVPVADPVPADLGPGAVVDVWIVEDVGDEQRPVPRKALTGIDVRSVDSGDGGLVTSGTTAAELLLDEAGTQTVLAALAAGHRVDLVVAPGTGPADR